MPDCPSDKSELFVEPWTQAGADLPKAVLNLAKPDSRKQKRKIQKSKIEREELQTKLPKRDLKATETVSPFRRPNSGSSGRFKFVET